MAVPRTPQDAGAPEGAVEIVDLTRSFGDVMAVDHVSLHVPARTIFGLLGPNGAGKSTLIRMLITLLPTTSGTARVAGFDIVDQPVQVRKRIGYVPQLLSADGALTGYENLDLFAKLYGIPRACRRERILEALHLMGLSDVTDRVASHYSGGMIRRLEIAQSMLHRPAVLFLDEPTVGLDPVARRAVWERLRQLREQFGTTIVMSTHDMEEADLLCERIALMARGRVVVQGPPSQLKANVGPEATMEEAFVHYSGQALEAAEEFGNVRQTRRSTNRLG
ncbi:Daunorubicin/doxorubicin resistance ATP-binding protein DrrA [compost metagenome]